MSKINIIAELAQGYEGKVFLAKQLIESAKLAGADYAKIQVVFADELATLVVQQRSGEQTGFAQNLKSVADTEYPTTLFCMVDDRLHNG